MTVCIFRGGCMLKKYVLPVIVCLCGVSLAQAQIQQIRDVLPNDKVTSLEINPSMDVLDDNDGVSLSKMTMKGYYKFAPDMTAGIEVPLARFESPVESKDGLGDTTVSLNFGRYNEGETWSYGAVAEGILPTATSRALGAGKLQFNPSVYGVYQANENWFMAAGYKQYWSVVGDHARDNINYARLRFVVAYLSDTNWWAMIDPRYYIDYDNKGQAKFQPEFEVGTMINEGTAVYLRGGGKMGGNMPGADWTVSMGFKILYL